MTERARERVSRLPRRVASTPVGTFGAAGMFTVEFFTDKIPYLDSAWDSIHTVIRP